MRADALAYVAPPVAGTGPPVVVLHSWWGMTSSFPAYADRLAGAGFLAGCVDLYDGQVAESAADVKRLRSRRRREPMYRTLLRAADELRAHDASASSRVGVVGFSMGGHWALWLAQREDFGAGAAVLYYAARTVRPDAPPVPVLAHYAEHDPFVTAAGRRAMERSLVRAGWSYRAVDHPGTSHWFAESADPSYSPVAAETAFGQTRRFLQEAAW